MNVDLEWYITFLTKQQCEALKKGHGISETNGNEATVSLSFLVMLDLAICFVGKVHVTKMKLNLNFCPLGLQIPQTNYCIFKKPMICTNLITFNAKLSSHAAERGQYVL